MDPLFVLVILMFITLIISWATPSALISVLIGSAASSTPFIYISSILLTATYGFLYPAEEAMPKDLAGLAYGVLLFFNLLGMFAGKAIKDLIIKYR